MATFKHVFTPVDDNEEEIEVTAYYRGFLNSYMEQLPNPLEWMEYELLYIEAEDGEDMTERFGKEALRHAEEYEPKRVI